ncbi:M23 family metallopeptidase [Sphingomonas psychrotolerans]|uniref:M23 family metallopeptidase n=1 Tax=Sphingomonas psychrotolerans TaxID=1327635 RepID=A0ABU3N435_9SPHN|nr:M23 family metallopeptidase [Sphingomonas psychrotolerans]MDT8759295.1 M23 family metallopeptidase [Sphingomonas psychrotolerans]
MTLNALFHSDSVFAGGGDIFDDGVFGGHRALFLRNDHGLELGGGAVVTPAFPPVPGTALSTKLKRRVFADLDLAPDLGARIGTLTWYRGVATCIGLCALTFLMAPGFETPIYGTVAPALTGAELDAARAQAIRPLAMGATTGYRVAATNLVAPLTDTPERPIISLDAKLASGDALLSVLRRSGVGAADAEQVGALVTKAVSFDEIQPGTMLDITLGRRTDKAQARPLQNMAFRAKFDLKLEVARSGNQLSLKQIPIAIDHTPLRVQGAIGSSLYRSARAAGAPAKAVESFIRTLATRVPVSHLGSDCKFDIIVKQDRAATGEVQLGNLLYAGVSGCENKVQLMPWESNGKTEWFDGGGKGNRTGMMAMPTNGRFSSAFGMRRHPILGYTRMHKGIDIAAPWGTPVYAATDGVVQFAGRSSGYGNFIKLSHGGEFGTGYGHLSRIVVRSGQSVRKGQVIGAVGNTGMSTGPHLHYELYKNGMAVNPRSVAFSSLRQLTGSDLGAFRLKLSQLLSVPVGRGAVKEAD